MRKNIFCFLLAVIMIFFLASCGVGEMKIEDYEWKMRSIIHGESDTVVYDAVGEADALQPQASVIDMTLVAKDGKITISDKTNNTVYEGTYTVSGKNPEGTDYRVTIDGKSGYATVGATTYADGKEEPTLPIMLDGYSIYFIASK